MHNILYYSFPESEKCEEIEQELSVYVSHQTYQEGGHMSKIRWLKRTPLDDVDAADEYLKKNDSGWYDCLAVRYKEPLDNAKLREAQRKVNAAWAKVRTMEQEKYVDFLKSQFISCKECGSKLNRIFLAKPGMRVNKCPVCGAELRPKSMLDRIEKAKLAAKKAEMQYKEIAQKSKSRIMWRVKIEFHT